MATLYYLSTRPESRFCESHSTDGYTPVLNDETERGDTLHEDFDAAWRLAQDIAYDLPGAKGMDVIEVRFEDTLLATLQESGDIRLGSTSDCFGGRIAALSTRACHLLNHSAQFSKREFLIPEEHLPMLGGAEHRGSGTLH